MSHLVCRACGTSYALDERTWRCRCGGLFDLDLGFAVTAGAFTGLGAQPWSLWRYRRALPFNASSTGWQSVTLGEGATPLLDDGGGLVLKVDFLMPTLSFKDRGSVVLVAKAAEMGVRRLVSDSSGNAGVSIAAYAARAGIAADVFVPGATSGKKLAQLAAFGAHVHQVPGSRADAAEAAIDHVETTGAFYASHVYNPLFHHGTKTIAFEIWEQLGGRLPETVFLPAGNGTLLIGAAIGFGELVAAGLAERVPRLVAVQARGCAPLARALAPSGGVIGAEPGDQTAGFEAGDGSGETAAGGTAAEGTAAAGGTAAAEGTAAAGGTAAEGIAIAEPPRLAQMAAMVRDSRGEVLTVTEGHIAEARAVLGAKGIDVEPTAAAAYGAWRAWRDRSEGPAGPEPMSPARLTVLPLTGAGLKSPFVPPA